MPDEQDVAAKALYLDDSYLRECDSTVLSVKDGKYVVLDQTLFYPMGGGVLHDTGAMIAGNERYNVVYVGKFSGQISHEVDRHELFQRDIAVKSYELPREEAMEIPGVVKLAAALPPAVKNLRIVEIDGVDRQADGGCHVRNLREVGRIEFLKAQNKGKNNRRVYYRLLP